MERTLALETLKKVGEKVVLKGWVANQRVMGKMTFVDLRDRSGVVQCVGFDTMKDLTSESVIEIVGIVKSRPEKQVNEESNTGSVEIEVDDYKIHSKAEALPIQVNAKAQNETEIDARLDYRWIDLRKPEKNMIFEVWTELEKAFREYWTSNKYIEIHSPKLLGAPSESGAEVFEVKYFDRTAYLAQSPQFYKQMAMASGFERVFEVGPVFRAENSNTIRHTTEFTGYDAEISYIDSHADVMSELEKLIVKGITSVKANCSEMISQTIGVNIEVPTIPFPVLTISKAKEILGKLGIKSEKSGDLSSEEEKAIGEYVSRELSHDFVFITEYPHEGRAFYHMRLETNNELTKGFDLLYKGLEIVTGAQREHRYEVLEKQAQERKMNLDLIQFYLDFFRYGCPPHGGFGMGPSRLLMKLLNLGSIRETMYLFRNPRRLNP